MEPELLQVHRLPWIQRQCPRSQLQLQCLNRRRTLANQHRKMIYYSGQLGPMQWWKPSMWPNSEPKLRHQGLPMGRKHLEAMEHPLSLRLLIYKKSRNILLINLLEAKTTKNLIKYLLEDYECEDMSDPINKITECSHYSQWSKCSQCKMSKYPKPGPESGPKYLLRLQKLMPALLSTCSLYT